MLLNVAVREAVWFKVLKKTDIFLENSFITGNHTKFKEQILDTYTAVFTLKETITAETG